MVSLIRRNPVTVDRSDDRPGATSWTSPPASTGCPKANAAKSEIVGFLGGLGAVSGNAIADEPSTDGVGVGVDSDIATERLRRSAAIPRHGIAYRSTASPELDH